MNVGCERKIKKKRIQIKKEVEELETFLNGEAIKSYPPDMKYLLGQYKTHAMRCNLWLRALEEIIYKDK